MENTNFKGTRGKVFKTQAYTSQRSKNPIKTSILNTDGVIATINYSGDIECDTENAKLIVDAFNVRQQINIDLPELLKQRNELLDMLYKTKNHLEEIQKTLNRSDINQRILKIENLIQQSKV